MGKKKPREGWDVVTPEPEQTAGPDYMDKAINLQAAVLHTKELARIARDGEFMDNGFDALLSAIIVLCDTALRENEV